MAPVTRSRWKTEGPGVTTGPFASRAPNGSGHQGALASNIPFGMTPADSLDDEPEPDDPAPPAKGTERATQAAEMKRTAQWLAYMRVTDGLEQRMLGAWRSFLTWMLKATLANLGQAARVTQSMSRQDDTGDPVPPDGAVDERAVASTEDAERSQQPV